MIEDKSGRIAEILESSGITAKNVADLVAAEIPTDMYHAVVSSSFDADRLDYLPRDRYMTGTGAGAIDLDWLMDNIRVLRKLISRLMQMVAILSMNTASASDTRHVKQRKIFC